MIILVLFFFQMGLLYKGRRLKLGSEKQMKKLRKIIYNDMSQRNTQYGYEGNSIISLGNRRKHQLLKKEFKLLNRNKKHQFLIESGVH